MERYILPLVVDADTDTIDRFPNYLPVTVHLYDGSFTEIPRKVFDAHAIPLPSDPVYKETSLEDINSFLHASVMNQINGAKLD